MLNPFVRETLGPKPSERPPQDEVRADEDLHLEFKLSTPFSERPDSEKEDLFYKIEGLVAERRRLTRDMLAERRIESGEEDEPEQQFVMKKVGARFIRVPVKPKTAHETYRSESVQQAQDRLQEVKDKLEQIGQIPGMHEAYETKLRKLYFSLKMLRRYESMKERLGEIQAILEEIYETSGVRSGGAVAGRALKQAEMLEAEKAGLEAKVQLIEGKNPRGLELADEEKTLVQEIEDLKKAMREGDDLKLAIEKIGKKIDELQQENDDNNHDAEIQALESERENKQVRLTELMRLLENADEDLNKLEERKMQIQVELDQLAPIRAAAEEIYRPYQLRSYAEDASRERLVNIPQVEKLTELGLEKLRSRQPFLLSGHLGSGKTEMARHIAKLHMLENGIGYDPESEDPDVVYDRLQVEIFSGGEDTTVYDLIGKQKLTGHSGDNPALAAKRADAIYEELQKTSYHDIPKEEIIRMLLGKADITVTKFAYGPLSRSLRDGKPIIVDEVNMIPSEVLGRLNDIMLARVGSKVALQENGQEVMEVKPGFAILGTCNFGAIYTGTQAMNAAFKSRWVMREVDYPEVDETYDLILASLVQKDRLRLPPKFPAEKFDSLARLAVTVNEIQQIFSGKTEGSRFMAMSSGVSAERSGLEQNVVSTRDLMRKIVIPWKASNFTKSLEEIIAENILASASDHADDQKLMTELFLRRGFFADWKERDFRAGGVQNVSQREIDALTAVMDSDDYKAADAQFGDLLDTATANTQSLTRHLLVETQQN